MHIRDIAAEDNAAIKSIIQDSLKSFNLAVPGSAYFDSNLNDLHSFYGNQECAGYWVLDIAGAVRGGIGIAPFDSVPGVCELQKLYISPEAQGQGYAKLLMDTALEFAAQHFNQCYLETSTKLKAAGGLYRKFGFTSLEHPLPGSEHSAMDMWLLRSLESKSTRCDHG